MFSRLIKLTTLLFGLSLSFAPLPAQPQEQLSQRSNEAGPRPFFEQSSDPSSLLDIGWLFTKDYEGETELFYEDASGNILQITDVGYISAAGLAGSLNLTGDIVLSQVVDPDAPTAALSSPASPGNVDNGDHDYVVTFVALNGETLGSSPSNTVTVVDKTVNGKIRVTDVPISVDHSVTYRRLYRRFNGAGDYKLVATLSDNTTTDYTDNTANAGLGSAAPLRNTTGSIVVGGELTVERRLLGSSTAATAANDLVLGAANQFIVAGNTQINAIDVEGWSAGSKITLIFTGTPTVKHNTAGGAGTAVLLLNGSIDLSATTDTVLCLEYDGTSWQEVSRKVP